MRWHDIQLEERAWVWTIPREDTKNKELHRVPLSRQAVRLLEKRRKPTAGSQSSRLRHAGVVGSSA